MADAQGNETTRVAVLGLGPIGLECARALLDPDRSRRLALVAAIDTDPEKAGRDLSELLGGGCGAGIEVAADLETALEAARPDVVLHAAGSFLERIEPQLVAAIEAGAHVVSSAEELLFPFDRHPRLSEALDVRARKQGVVLLGTGVNPGYVMDTLVVAATAVCLTVRSVEAVRVVDAATRRLPLQKKIGAGLSAEEFQARRQAGNIGHIGLRESLLFVIHGLGLPCERVVEELSPVIAARAVTTDHLSVKPGEVAGIHQTAVAEARGRQVASLVLQMYVGAEDPHDAVKVDGDPPIDLLIRGGIFGDTATVAALINAVPLVGHAAPGLRTMAELRLPRGTFGG